MKYYFVAGEASGDLHAAHLMAALRKADAQAEFRFVGGDRMTAQGGERLMHCGDIAFMGFVPVLLHLRTILTALKRCKRDIERWRPDALVLVDYPGFNLRIARFAHALGIPVFYYISPKIWAWKERRIHRIRRDVDRVLSILPFEVDYFRTRHGLEVCYVGNPTADEIAAFKTLPQPSLTDVLGATDDARPIIALLPGSRRHEIADNLPRMLAAVSTFANFQPVVAGAPNITPDFYRAVAGEVTVVYDRTYALLSLSHAAVVTSGTATLETALLGVPQVVCYYTPLGKLVSLLRKWVLKVRFVSLVNLIADREVVRELIAGGMTVANLSTELQSILTDETHRKRIFAGYDLVASRLGASVAPERAAAEIINFFEK
jgi:lipid-A-disaccharide synthase